MDIAKYNFPEGTTINTVEKNGEIFYILSYVSPNMVDTPFGLRPEKYFSTENRTFDEAVNSMQNTLESNGYNFETKIWQ